MSIKKSTIVAFFLLLPLLEPAFFAQVSLLHLVYKYGGYISLFVLAMREILLNISNIKKYFNKTLFWFIALFGLLVVTTLVNKTSISYILNTYLPILALCLWMDIYSRKDVKGMLKCLALLFDIFILANILSIIFFPKGLYISGADGGARYVCYFLGYKNPQIRFLLPALGLGFANDFVSKGKITIRSIIRTIVVVITVFILKSSTAIVGICAFSLGYIIWRRYKKKRFFDFLQLKYFYFASGIISILIIGFSFQNNFADIIEQLFDKSVTFTGRTNIWELALSKVPESPWIGHGMESLHVIVGDAYFDAPHAHNYFLQQLFSVGIIGLIIATMIWLTASKNCHRYFNSESAKALMLAAAALIFTGITESLTEAPLLYPLLCLIHNMEFFVEPVKKGELSKVSAG